MLSEQQQRIMGYFIEEAKDHLNTIEQGLLNLKATIDDPEMVHEVFRAAHSVKGGAAMLGLTSIQHTAHRLEDYFKVLKECPVHIDQKLETLLLRVYDTLQELLEQLQRPFGLTDDKAEEAMAEVEPVFVELNQHLGQLVAQVGGQPPEDVSLASPVPASVLEAPTQSQPVAEESALRFIFHNDVPARLREMLQLFKQDDTPETRQQLRTLCRQLSQPGEQLDLPAWCDLLETAERAIAHSENSYRALAPVVIKDIKRAQEQVLAGHINGITVSNDLLLLLPPEEFSIPEETQFDADLADLLGSAEDDELGLFAMESVTAVDPNLGFLDLDELATAAELDANDSDSVFNLDPLLAADNNSHEPQLNFDLIDQIDEALPSASHAQGGPEVGTAELNSLADLFEGEDADLGLAWQEEVIGEAVDSTPEPLEFDATSDFSDLLFQDGSEDLALQEMDEDLSGLLNQTAEQVEAMSEPAIDFGFDESSVEAEDLSFDFTNLEDSEAATEPDEVDDAFLFSLPAEEASSGANAESGQSQDLDALFSELPGDELSLESELIEPINPSANESSIEALFASDDATDAAVPFELDLESADLLDLSFESGDELTAAGLDLSDFEMGNDELLLDDGSANLVAEEEGLSSEDFDLAGLEQLDLSQSEQPQPEQPPALSEHEPSYQPEVVADPWTDLELSPTDLEQPIQSANDLSAGWSDDSTPTELEPFSLEQELESPNLDLETDMNWLEASGQNEQPGAEPLDQMLVNFNEFDALAQPNLELSADEAVDLDLNFEALNPDVSDADFGTEIEASTDTDISDELNLDLFDQPGTSDELDLNFDQLGTSDELDLNFDQPSTSDELDLNFDQPSTSDELDLNLFDQSGASEPELDLNLFDQSSTSEPELDLNFDQLSTSEPELNLFDQPSTSDELDLNFDQASTSDELDLNFDQASTSDELDLNFDQASTSEPELDLNLFDQAEASEPELNLFDQADAAEVAEIPSLNSDLSDLDLNLFADGEEINEQMQDVPADSADSLDFDNPFEIDVTAEAGPEISELELDESDNLAEFELSDLFVESEVGDLASEETEAELGDLDNLFTLSSELPDTRSDHPLADETLSGTFDQDLAAELPAADFNIAADLPDAELADFELSELDLFAAADDNPDASTAGMEFEQQSELFQDSAATDFDLDLEMETAEPPVFSADLGLPEPESSNSEDSANAEFWFESAIAEASQNEAPVDLGLWQDAADVSADDLTTLDFSTLELDAAEPSALPDLTDEASFDFGFDAALETTEPTAEMQAEESGFDLDFLNLEAAAIEPEPNITDLAFPDDLGAEAAIDLDLSDLDGETLGNETAAELNFWGEPESEISLDAGDLDLSLPELEFNQGEAQTKELPDLDFELAELGEEQPDQSAAESSPSTDEFADLADFFGTDTTADTDLNAGDLFDAVELSSDGLDFSDPVPTEDTSTAADDFGDLETMLGGVDTADAVSAEHAPLDDLQAVLADDMPTVTAIHEADDDFADLEALLEEPVELAPGLTDAAELHSVVSSIPTVEDEFSDLEALLQDADQTLGGGSSPARKSSTAINRRSNRRGGLSDQTMRVTVRHLDNLNNLVGEMVVNRNSLEQAQERLRQFLDNLLYQVQQLSDVGQRMRDLYERSLLESSLLSSRRGGYQAAAPSNFNVAQTSHATGASFDALEMDRFTGFHTLSQEMIELIVRVRESASDIDFVVEETDQVTRNFRQITTQLQEGLTRSRMVPFAQTADRLPRGVRDNSLKYGKQAELIIEGRDTLIDKMIVEQLYDPMTHLVNNAIAHGIETPEERIAAGKSPTGRIVIRAFHQGNQTVISVSDDGAGINPEQVRAKALAKGLITPVQAREMSRLDTYDLLFQHGFSTVDQVDDLRGRGVGLDVVRNNLNEIRGAITIDSVIGKGTSFTIRLPLTLSISKALCCISNRARIAFPMDGVEDMLDVPQERILTDEQGRQCIQWRDLLLPFQPLSELLRYNRVLGRGSVYGGNQEEDMISIVVLRSAGNFLALQVDQVLGEQEIVIKQLEGPVPKPLGVAGATVLGDGRIMPIADVLELIDLWQGRIRRESGSSLWDKGESQMPPESIAKSEPTVLIVDDSITVRELLSMTFSKVGYRVEQARDGQEAWEKLRSGLPCDLVFCDIEMPRMDGLELLSRIQKDPNLSHLPIAMLTSRGADRHRQMAVQLGAKGYFTKPYLEEVLLDAAQRMLKGEVMVMGNSIQ